MTRPEEPMLSDVEDMTIPGPPTDSVTPGTTTTPPVGSMGMIEGPTVIAGGWMGVPGFDGSFGVRVGDGSLFSSPFPFVDSAFPGIGIPLPFVGSGVSFSSPFPLVGCGIPVSSPVPFVGCGSSGSRG